MFSPPSAMAVISSLPENPVLGGSDYVCLGNNTQITPSTNGTWTSSDTTILKVSNLGLVQGLAFGTAQLTYQRNTDGCSSQVDFMYLKIPRRQPSEKLFNLLVLLHRVVSIY